MQLGQEAEARAQLEQCYNAKDTSNETVNALRLLDSYKDYQTFKTDNTIHPAAQQRSRSAAPVF